MYPLSRRIDRSLRGSHRTWISSSLQLQKHVPPSSLHTLSSHHFPETYNTGNRSIQWQTRSHLPPPWKCKSCKLSRSAHETKHLHRHERIKLGMLPGNQSVELWVYWPATLKENGEYSYGDLQYSSGAFAQQTMDKVDILQKVVIDADLINKLDPTAVKDRGRDSGPLEFNILSIYMNLPRIGLRNLGLIPRGLPERQPAKKRRIEEENIQVKKHIKVEDIKAEKRIKVEQNIKAEDAIKVEKQEVAVDDFEGLRKVKVEQAAEGSGLKNGVRVIIRGRMCELRRVKSALSSTATD